MNKFSALISLLVLLCSCEGQDKFLRWYERHLTYEDKAMYKTDFWEKNVRKANEVREKMDWGVPDDIYRHFVLPVQVVERPLDNFRLAYADSLCKRVEGMSMWEAAREINYWCLERAGYKEEDCSSDSAMGTLERGHGACEELTNLYVSALRAAGIPARAASVSWLHAATAHKWTEVWVDGEWHFEGSVEPNEDLDVSWLCGGACKAMVIPVKVFGRYKGSEPVLSADKHWTVIDRGARYEPRRTTSVKVVDDKGRSVRGATVEFKIFNSGNLFTLYSTKSDRNGIASLETAQTGSVVVWACKDGMYGFCRADKEQNGLAMTHPLSKGGSAEFLINSPDRYALPYEPTEEQKERKSARVKHAEALRNARLARPVSDSLINAYRTEVTRPHLPSTDWAMPGKTILELYGDSNLKPGVNCGICRVLEDGSTERVWSQMLDPGTYILSCSSRAIAYSALVKSTVFTIPEGTASIAIQAAVPTVPPATDMKCLYKIKDRSCFDPCQAKCQVICLIESLHDVIYHWAEDTGKTVPGYKCIWADAERSDNKKATETLLEIRDALGLKTQFVIVTDPEGNIWYATDNWDSNTEYEMTAVRNALEMR